MRLRRAVYWKYGAPITLSFVGFIADDHPELVDNTPSPPPAAPPKVKAERGPRLTDNYIRIVLGKDRRHTTQVRDRLSYQATMRRIERGEV
jgi:hypothetical protein